MNPFIFIFIVFIIFIFYLFFIYKKEYFNSFEKNINKYINFNNNNACLMMRKITPDGGEYFFQIINNPEDYKPTTNQKIRYFNDEFTKEMCNKDFLGSGRKIGFECIDFMTENEAKQVDLIYSNKTCFDKLNYKLDLPIYK